MRDVLGDVARLFAGLAADRQHGTRTATGARAMPDAANRALPLEDTATDAQPGIR